MNKIVVSILLLTVAQFINAQDNLVVNPGFEDDSPINRGVYKVKHGRGPIRAWRNPLRNNPVLFITPKKAVAVAKSGYAAVGIILGSSKQNKTKFQSITGRLKTPLEKGETYCVSFNMLLHRTSRWAATDVGVLFHHDRKVVSDISDPQSLTASIYANDGNAVINTKWQKFSGYYKASGGEQFLSFGKFGTSNALQLKTIKQQQYFETDNYQSKAFYQVDDISVVKSTADSDCGCAEKLPNEEDSLYIPPALPPYLFALDASGSMKKGGLFDSLRVNLARFLDELPIGTPVTFTTFASSSRKLFAGRINENSSFIVDSLLSRAPIGGGTSVFAGLRMAYDSWDTPGPDSAKMVLITDGEFNVTPNVVDIIKTQYETEGRKLTLIQIGSRASVLSQVKPYMDSYIHTTPSELGQVVSQLHGQRGGAAGMAMPCDCIEEFSDTMNYHFVIDYSGSMAQEKMRAISAVKYLFDKIPDNAMISFTTFNRSADLLYQGKKSETTKEDLIRMLRREQTGGGTDPVPGIKYGLRLAKSTSEGRFSHLVLITDLTAPKLSKYIELSRDMKRSMKEFDLAGSTMTVDEGGFVATYSQFDEATGNHVGVGRIKFEKDLFYTQRSSCNFTSQPYHYSPGKAAMKTHGKKVVGRTIMGAIKIAL